MRVFYRGKLEKKAKKRLSLGAGLSYLLIATLLFTGISFSRFATSGDAGDGARVALVMLDAGKSSEPDAIDVMDGATESICEFYVTNGDSEVALEYAITVTVPESVASGLTLKLQDSQGNAYDCETTGNVHTFTGGTFTAGVNENHTYQLILTGNSALVGSGTADIKISVAAQQID